MHKSTKCSELSEDKLQGYVQLKVRLKTAFVSRDTVSWSQELGETIPNSQPIDTGSCFHKLERSVAADANTEQWSWRLNIDIDGWPIEEHLQRRLQRRHCGWCQLSREFDFIKRDRQRSRRHADDELERSRCGTRSQGEHRTSSEQSLTKLNDDSERRQWTDV